MSFSTLLRLPPFLLVSIFASTYIATASQDPPSSSSSASTNLICHTEVLADCYPAVFSPTKYFQVVHDDQSIPPGLHIRMNLATGLKEARLNVPEPERGDGAAIVVINESEGPTDGVKHTLHVPPEGQLVIQDGKVEQNPFNVIADGSVPKTVPQGDLPSLMSRVIEALERAEGIPTVADMEELADLAYDVELGATITSNSRLTKALMRLIENNASNSEGSNGVRAIDILGAALHNNPTALQYLMANEGQKARSPATIVIERLQKIFPAELARHPGPDFYRANRLVFLLSQLCQERIELDVFLERNGLHILNLMLAAPSTSEAEHEKTRLKIRIAHFLTDLAPSLSEAVQQGKGKSTHLVELCESFRLDPGVRYDTTSVEYTSTKAAGEALREIAGGDCFK